LYTYRVVAFNAAGESPSNELTMGQVPIVSPPALAFADQLVGTASAPLTVTLRATTTALTINSITITGANAGDFTLGAGNCGAVLAAGRSCNIPIRFRPLAAGPRTAALTIADSDPTSPQVVPLSGSGIAPVNSVSPTALTFSSPLNVRTAAQTVTVSNTGAAPLRINGIGLSGANPGQFARTDTCGPFPATLAAGASCTIDVTFRPTSVGDKSASLNVNVAAPATSRSVALTGTVVVPTFTLSPGALAFGDQARNTTSAAQTITVSNTGAAPLRINNIRRIGANPGQFAHTHTCGAFPATLAPGASCTVSVTFRPTSLGPKSAALEVRVAAPATSQPVPLTGTGI
jgi:hypothetical protein